MKTKILITRKISEAAEEKLKNKFDVTLNLEDIPIPYEELINKANEHDGIVSTGWDKLDENFFNNIKDKLKIIAQVGVGYDNIAISSAKEKKIKVTNSPNVIDQAFST